MPPSAVLFRRILLLLLLLLLRCFNRQIKAGRLHFDLKGGLLLELSGGFRGNNVLALLFHLLLLGFQLGLDLLDKLLIFAVSPRFALATAEAPGHPGFLGAAELPVHNYPMLVNLATVHLPNRPYTKTIC